MKLVLSNLSTAYTKTPILNGLNARVKPGEFIGLVGPNGSGKSCLLKTIAGLLAPHKGSVNLDDASIHGMGSKTRARLMSYLAQDKSAQWPLPVYNMVALGRAPYRGTLGKLSEQDKRAVEYALGAAQCNDLRDRRFDHLSGGEQMRVHLARALAVDAPLLLADEPNTALDPYYQISLMDALSAQVKTGTTVIASLHDLTLAKQFCTRIWVLHDGKLLKDDIPKDALNDDLLAKAFNVKREKNHWVAT